MWKLLRIIPVFLCLISCSFPFPGSRDKSEEITSKEYAVYEAVIKSNWPGQAQIVLSDTTDLQMLRDVSTQIDGNLPGMGADTLAQFLLRNQKEYPLVDHFLPSDHVVLLSQAERNIIFDTNLEEGWKQFNQNYPGAQGLLTLSRVGFNLKGTQALVYFGNQKGSVNGAGYVVLLDYEKDGWVVTTQWMIWIS